MKYFYILLIILFLGCVPKNNIKLSREEKNIEEIINSKNFNPEIIEKANVTDGFGKNSLRLRQNLRDTDEIINDIKNYYAKINDDGSININKSIVYPYISNTQIINYEHISRQYDGAYVDLSIFTILLENNQTINVRIFSPYESLNEAHIYFFSNNNYEATKGYYEYGNAINALKNNPLKKIKNNANIEVTIFSDYSYESYHKYIYLGPISKYYNSEYYIAKDRYSYFIIDIFSIDDTNEMELYYKKIIENIKYW
jgi:hypothetical protein